MLSQCKDPTGKTRHAANTPLFWMLLFCLAVASSAQVCPASDKDAKHCTGGTHSIAPDNFVVTGAAACCKLCQDHPDCFAWVMQTEKTDSHYLCHLKDDNFVLKSGGDKYCGIVRTAPTPVPTPPLPPPKGAKNVLFLVSDDFRPSSGAYGVEEASTPNLDKLAADGILFTAAHVQISYCAPSRNSFMSG